MGKAGRIENQGKSFDSDWEVLDAAEAKYRKALGDGLEIVFGRGADTLGAVCEGLNEIGCHAPKGQRWTEPLLKTELERLAR